MIKFARISKNGFLGCFGTVRPESWRTRFFGKNPAGSIFFEYCPPTSGKKLRKSLEPFSRIFWFTIIFGPLWAILGHFGTVWPKIRKTGFFGRNPALSVFIIYGPQTSCQKSEKSLEPFSRTFASNRPTDRPTIPAWAHLQEVRTVTFYRTWLTSRLQILLKYKNL